LAQVKGNPVFQFGFEHPKITVALEAAKVLLGDQEGRGTQSRTR
jgi:hypothetical protein